MMTDCRGRFIAANRVGWWLSLSLAPCCGAVAQAPFPPPSRVVPMTIDSGPVVNTTGERAMVYSTEVWLPDAAWMRLNFSQVTLPGDATDETGATLVLTSLADGSTQRLNAEQVAQWHETTAFFNGPLVRIELWAAPGREPARVIIKSVLTSDASVRTPQDLCGADDRVLSFDNRTCRTDNGCTAWLISDTNKMFLTAGHCASPSPPATIYFNVPLSTASGTYQFPSADDQYAVDTASAQSLNGGVGNDWCYFGVFPNSNHGQLPRQRYGVNFVLSGAAPAPAGQTIRVTGYGTTSAPVSSTWNGVQKTHSGAYSSLAGTTLRYLVDTTGGNSGSPVINEATGQAIGIHTHAGCTTGGNYGTAIQLASLQTALNNPLSICRSGRGTVGGTLFAIGDRANNFGTVRITPNNFARVAQVGARWSGLAWNQAAGSFYAIDQARSLFTVSPAGVATLIGTVSGTTAVLSGLGYDPVSGALYAYGSSTGQLYRINTGTLAVTIVGAAQGGTVRGIDFDVPRATLWGIDNLGGPKLVRINTSSGARTVIGSLGAGITDTGDVASDPSDGFLYTIVPTTGTLARINTATGAATLLGATNGSFTNTFGMASSAAVPVVACSIADIVGVGGNAPADGLLTGDDFNAFISAFAAGTALADIVGIGGSPPGDGLITGDDFNAFIGAFAAGCP